MNKNRVWLKQLLTMISAFLLGISLTFAFAPYEIFPLAFLAPIGLLALWTRSPSPTFAFNRGFLFGLGFFGAGVYWVFISIHDIGQVPNLLAGVITVAMISVLAIYPAAVGYFLNRYFPLNNSAKLIYAFPAIWVISEWLRSVLFTGFPWLILGYSQTNSPLKGFAPLLSVFSISLALTLTSGLIVNAFFKYKQKDYRATYLNLFTFITIWIAGGAFSLIPWTQAKGDPISIALVQGNIPQTIKWSPEHLELSLDRYAALTEPLWGKYQLIVWPEAAIPIPLHQTEDYINQMDAKASASHSQLLLGIPIQTQNKSGYYNAIVSLGNERNVYLKRRLVPFGEYIPFSEYLSQALNFMNLPMSDMVSGNDDQKPLRIENTTILPSICYEITFPLLSRTTNQDIGFILTVTNDAWFGESNAQAQHLQMAAMRSLELGRPALFVTNDGITAIIGQDGRVIAALPAHQAAVLTGMIQPRFGFTPWMFNGFDPLLLMLLCMIFVAVRTNKKNLPRAMVNPLCAHNSRDKLQDNSNTS